MQVIDNISMGAVSAAVGTSKKMGATYLWYETTRGFCFQTLEHLFTLDSVKTFSMTPSSVVRDENGLRNIDFESREIKSFSVVQSFDTLNKTKEGMYANTTIMHDPINKTIEEYDYNYIRDYENHSHLEGNIKSSIISSGSGNSVKSTGGFMCSPYVDEYGMTISDYTKSVIILHPKATRLWDDVDSDHSEEWKPKRRPHMEQLNSFEVEISIIGDSEIQVGDVVELLIPTSDVVEGQANIYSGIMSGRYLVTAITHSLGLTDYSQKLILNKESLVVPIT